MCKLNKLKIYLFEDDHNTRGKILIVYLKSKNKNDENIETHGWLAETSTIYRQLFLSLVWAKGFILCKNRLKRK